MSFTIIIIVISVVIIIVMIAIIIIIIRITTNTKDICILRYALFWVITLRKNPEERSAYLPGGGSLQSRISVPQRRLQIALLYRSSLKEQQIHIPLCKLRTRDIRKSAAGSAVHVASLCLMTCFIVV